MEPLRITKTYLGVTLDFARLRGKYIGHAIFLGEKLTEAKGDSYEAVEYALMAWITANPQVALQAALMLAPIAHVHRGVAIRYAEFNNLVLAVAEIRRKSLFEANATSKEDALNQARAWIDANWEVIDKAIRENHRRVLTKYGVPSSGEIQERPISINNRFRAAHCWACHHPIDNESQLECTGCGWIICFCGACGCSYEQSNNGRTR